MELQKNTEVKSTTQYWGYRELTAAELLNVAGGDHDDFGGSPADYGLYLGNDGEYRPIDTSRAGDR